MRAVHANELSLDDELFLMSNLFPKRTGLPFVVWISTGTGIPHDIRVKISRGPKAKPAEMIFVALQPKLRVREALLAYWNAEIDSGDVLERLRKVVAT
jgi:hypothetical protein